MVCVARAVCEEPPVIAEPDPGARIRAYAEVPEVGQWAAVAPALAATTVEGDPPVQALPTVRVGPDVEQTALQATAPGEVVAEE